jgi:hypothetical protein
VASGYLGSKSTEARLSNTGTEHRLRLFAIGWYLLGWIPCLALNAVGIPGKVCLGLYAACGMVVFMAGMSIARERAESAELERLHEIERGNEADQ